MIQRHGDYELDDTRARFAMARVRQWLMTTYWWPKDTKPSSIDRAFNNSLLIVGAYQNDEQVACLRVVTDLARFAWLADVYVAEAHRKRGLAKAMARFVLDHPECCTVTRFQLVTRDAHVIYAAVGFTPLPDPERFMQYRPKLGS